MGEAPHQFGGLFRARFPARPGGRSSRLLSASGQGRSANPRAILFFFIPASVTARRAGREFRKAWQIAIKCRKTGIRGLVHGNGRRGPRTFLRMLR